MFGESPSVHVLITSVVCHVHFSLSRDKELFIVISLCIFLVTKDAEHLFMCVLSMHISSLGTGLVKSSIHLERNFIELRVQ